MTLDSRQAGSGQLRVQMSAGQSSATSVWATSPLKILVPRPRGRSVWAYLSSFGGGLLARDQVSVTISVGEQARCFLGTQASTKVYRNPTAQPCSQHVQTRLERGAFLALLPDPIQSFTGSRYRQCQDFALAPDSGLVLVDWLCSGRAARGEKWAFERFQSRNEISLGDARVLVDSLLLDPAEGPLAGKYRMGRFNCLALVVVIGGLLQDASNRLLTDFAQRPISRQAKLVSSASPILHGALMRFAGESVEVVAQEIRQHLSFIPSFLGDDPWSRKF